MNQADSDRLVLHIDINSYFATLLQQETPPLRGKPVAVVKELGRTCVIAASNEAKKYGIKTGSSLNEARLRCPNLVVMPAKFELYQAATRKFYQLLNNLSPDVLIFSLDEAFIEYTPLKKLYPNPQTFASLVKDTIKQELGEWVGCNIGLGPNRFLAKMIGEVSPKGSIVEITQSSKDALLARVNFADVCGIGFRLEKKLKLFGITHPFQLNFFDDKQLYAMVGPFWSRELRAMGRGEEPLFLRRLGESVRGIDYAQSVGRSITGYRLTDDESIIEHTLYNLSEEVIYKVRKMSLVGRRVRIFLSGDNQHWSAHHTLALPICHIGDFFNLIYHRLYKSWHRSFSIIRFAVSLELLKPSRQFQPVWFPEWWRHEKIARALDQLTERYGLFAVTSGLHLGQSLIRPEVNGFFGDKNFYLGDLE